MDDDYFEKGLRMRKATLGAEFVEQYQARRMNLTNGSKKP